MIIRSVFAPRLHSKRNAASAAAPRPWPPSRGVFPLVLLFLLPIIAAAQITPPPLPSATEVPRPVVAAPAPSIASPIGGLNSVSAPLGYTLSANDQVSVEVFGEDELRTSARLSADGSLSLPLLGAVRLGGLTLAQAAARLTELYGRDYLVNPKVNVSLANYAKRRFTMLGQVNRPGSFEMPDGSAAGIDLLEAVAMAGGYTRIAAPERISVRRKGPNGDQILRVNGKDIARSGAAGSFRVEPGDTVTVGESIF